MGVKMAVGIVSSRKQKQKEFTATYYALASVQAFTRNHTVLPATPLPGSWHSDSLTSLNLHSNWGFEP